MIRVRCPICGKEMEGPSASSWPQFPVCSARCKTVDLGRWLGEAYRLPAEEPADAGPEEKDIP